MAVLLISSELEELERLCQRVAVLRDRAKVGELSGTNIQADAILNLIARHNE
jgi:simple sugar transport system ATP-binding protein